MHGEFLLGARNLFLWLVGPEGGRAVDGGSTMTVPVGGVEPGTAELLKEEECSRIKNSTRLYLILL